MSLLIKPIQVYKVKGFFLYVTWFAKTQNNPTRTEIQIMAWHESHTPALSRHTNGRATNSQVCFHRHHFCDPVNSWQSTMESVVPLGHTNKAMFGIKLLLATIPAWQVNCGCLCNTQWLLFCSNVWKNPPSAPHPPPIYWIHDIGEAWKKVPEIPAALVS